MILPCKIYHMNLSKLWICLFLLSLLHNIRAVVKLAWALPYQGTGKNPLSTVTNNCLYPDPIWILLCSSSWFYFHQLCPLHFCLSILISVGKDFFLDQKNFYTNLHEFFFPLYSIAQVQSFQWHTSAAVVFPYPRSLLSWFMFCKRTSAARYQRFLTTTTTMMAGICHITTLGPFFLDLELSLIL